MQVSSQFHTLAVLPAGKNPRHPFNRSQGGPQSQFECCVVEKNVHQDQMVWLEETVRQTPQI
jgi:hypothetical protein